jgi:hypothetical protein
MRKYCYLAFGALILTVLAQATQQGKAEDKGKASRTLNVKLDYSGAGRVDAKHKIIVFLFDSPEFTQGTAMPIAMKAAEAKDETVAFAELDKSPVYVVSVYDPTGGYDGQSGPPPSGSSMGMYSKTPGTPEPVKVEAGQTVGIELPFDDTAKMP